MKPSSPSILILGAALLVAFLVYAPSLGFAFLPLSDGPHLFQNLRVSYGLSSEGWAQVFDPQPAWQPVTWISHLVDMSLLGPSASLRRLENVLLHLVNMALLFLVLRRWTGEAIPAAFAAALFGLHPLRSEAVVWVAQRGILLVTLFALLTLWFATQGRRIPAAIAAMLALLSFPVTAPDTFREWLAAMWFHLRESVWPVNLAIGGSPSSSLEMGLGAAVLAVLIGGGFLLREKNQVAAFGLWWTAAAMLLFFTAPARAGRATYLAHLGLCTALVWIVSRIGASQIVLIARATGVLLAVFAGLTWARNSDFRDPFALLGQTRSAAGLSSDLQLSFAQLLFESGRFVESEKEFRSYTRMEPQSGNGWAGLGNALLSQKRQEDAAAAFREGTRRDPKFASNYYGLGLAETNLRQGAQAIASFEQAIKLGLDANPSAVACNNIGSILAGEKKFAEAQAWFERAIEYDIRFVAAHRNLALVLNDQGKRRAAINHLQTKGLLWTNNDEVLGRLNVDLINLESVEVSAARKKEFDRRKGAQK